jgi:hypothetical protein
MKFRVIDNNTDQYTEKAVTVYVYNSLSTGPIIVPSPVTVNNAATFNIDPTGGSGIFTYSWSIVTPWASYTGTSKSFSLTLGYDYYGSRTASCIVTDSRTGESKTINGGFIVDGAPTLVLKFIKSTITATAYFEDYNIASSLLTGSGHYTYSWYLDNSNSVSSTSSNYEINLSCSNPTDHVKCVVSDTRTGQTKTLEADYSFTGDCDGGPVEQ